MQDFCPRINMLKGIFFKKIQKSPDLECYFLAQEKHIRRASAFYSERPVVHLCARQRPSHGLGVQGSAAACELPAGPTKMCRNSRISGGACQVTGPGKRWKSWGRRRFSGGGSQVTGPFLGGLAGLDFLRKFLKNIFFRRAALLAVLECLIF